MQKKMLTMFSLTAQQAQNTKQLLMKTNVMRLCAIITFRLRRGKSNAQSVLACAVHARSVIVRNYDDTLLYCKFNYGPIYVCTRGYPSNLTNSNSIISVSFSI